MSSHDRASRLHGRHDECDLLDRLLAAVRDRESQVLVIRGEAGIGKTALLDHLAGRAEGCRVVRASGAESEMELPFAGLHQLCARCSATWTGCPGRSATRWPPRSG